MRTGPEALPGAAPSPRTSSTPSSCWGSASASPPDAVTGRLQHPDRPRLVECPLGVLGRPVVGFDLDTELGELPHLGVIENGLLGLVRIELASPRATALGRLDGQLLAAHFPFLDAEALLADDVAVGRDRAGDDGLAESEGALDDEPVGCPGGGVDGEHHPGASRRDLALHDQCDVHVGLAEAPLGPVVHGAGAEQRRPAAAHRAQQLVRTADVQQGLVHAGEGGGLGVLGGGRGAHRHRRLRIVGGKPAIGIENRPGEPLGHRLGLDLRAHLFGGALQRGGVLDVDPGEAIFDPPPQACLVAERRVGGSADDETGGNGKAGGA